MTDQVLPLSAAEPAKSLGQRIGSWDDLFTLRSGPVHVVGAGSVEGAHLLLFLLDHGFTDLVGHDFSSEDDFDRVFSRVHVGWPRGERAAMLGRIRSSVDLRLGDRYLQAIEDAAAIGVTQGWYLYDPNRPLSESAELQERFFGLVQLYLALAPGRVVGVSGSQGKSTTTRLLGDMLVAAGRDVILAGNDRHGQQALGRLETASPDSILLLEISNRHLKMLDRSPAVAVLTNVYPNHLDEHGGWDGYVEAKSRLLRYQRPEDVAVVYADQEVSHYLSTLTPAHIVYFGDGVEGTGGDVRVTGDLIEAVEPVALRMTREDVPLAGAHNMRNVAAATAAALALDVPPPAILDSVSRARGLKHRLQFIWESGGVRFYDDLNSTTPTATQAALETLGHDVVWILGGDDKGLDAGELATTATSAVRVAVALPGDGTERILAKLEDVGLDVKRAGDLAGAVALAAELAGPGDSVLLSPACPGFFSRYYVGAEDDVGFKKLVREATLGGGTRGRAAASPGAQAPVVEPTSPPARTPRE